MDEEWENVFCFMGYVHCPISLLDNTDKKEYNVLRDKISKSESLLEKVAFADFVFRNPKEAEKDKMYNSFFKNHELYIKNHV